MKKKNLNVRGKEIAYLDYGKKEAQIVLFLHGFPESSLLWKDAVQAVQEAGYRAIAPDLPGFGQSQTFDEASTWERYVEFISDFTAELSIDRFHLVTHDWGVLIGTKWACTFPERVQSLIIADATYSPDFLWHKDGLMIQSSGSGEEWVARLRNKLIFEAFMNKVIPNVSMEVVEDFYELFSDPNKDRVTLDLYRSGDMKKLEKYRGRLADYLSMPVTIIFGEHDFFISPDFGMKLKQNELNHADYCLIPSVGHFTPLEDPLAFNRILIYHLNRN